MKIASDRKPQLPWCTWNYCDRWTGEGKPRLEGETIRNWGTFKTVPAAHYRWTCVSADIHGFLLVWTDPSRFILALLSRVWHRLHLRYSSAELQLAPLVSLAAGCSLRELHGCRLRHCTRFTCRKWFRLLLEMFVSPVVECGAVPLWLWASLYWWCWLVAIAAAADVAVHLLLFISLCYHRQLSRFRKSKSCRFTYKMPKNLQEMKIVPF